MCVKLDGGLVKGVFLHPGGRLMYSLRAPISGVLRALVESQKITYKARPNDTVRGGGEALIDR